MFEYICAQKKGKRLLNSVRYQEQGPIETFSMYDSVAKPPRHPLMMTYAFLYEQKGNAIQQELRGEVQRLRAELLRQKRSYWQATAVLKDR